MNKTMKCSKCGWVHMLNSDKDYADFGYRCFRCGVDDKSRNSDVFVHAADGDCPIGSTIQQLNVIPPDGIPENCSKCGKALYHRGHTWQCLECGIGGGVCVSSKPVPEDMKTDTKNGTRNITVDAYERDLKLAKCLTSMDKVKEAQRVFHKAFKPVFPMDMPMANWLQSIAETKGLEYEGGFEYVYRCYHQSFKVANMRSMVELLLDLTIYLFSEDVPQDIYTIQKHSLCSRALWHKVSKGNQDQKLNHLTVLDQILIPDTLSWRYAKDILEREPESITGYIDYEMHHVALMGGVYWSIISLYSVLGMLEYAFNGGEFEGFVSYPEGTANGYLADVNYEELADLEIEEDDNFAADMRKMRADGRKTSIDLVSDIFKDGAIKALKDKFGLEVPIEVTGCSVSESRDAVVTVTVDGFETQMRVGYSDGWVVRKEFAGRMAWVPLETVRDMDVEDLKKPWAS